MVVTIESGLKPGSNFVLEVTPYLYNLNKTILGEFFCGFLVIEKIEKSKKKL